jgi:hypothetical protein
MRYSLILITTLFLASLSSASLAGKLYKWTDERGNVHYSDRIPPQEVTRAHTHLNQRGVTVDKVDRAKTAEELRAAEEEERLRKEQQALIAKQKAEDDVLRRSFRTEDDIVMTRDGQLMAIDANIRIARGNIKRLKIKLEEMQRDAAARELSGGKISAAFQKDIDNKNQALKSAYQSIVNQEHDKDRIRRSFARDLKRFRELKQLEETNDPIQEAEDSFVEALKNVYDCGEDEQCQEPWKRAKAYMRQHNTTPIKMDAQHILMGGRGLADEDISITLSRMRDNQRKRTLIFFDLQCKDSPKGQEFCRGEQVATIKNGFQAAVSEP